MKLMSTEETFVFLCLLNLFLLQSGERWDIAVKGLQFYIAITKQYVTNPSTLLKPAALNATPSVSKIYIVLVFNSCLKKHVILGCNQFFKWAPSNKKISDYKIWRTL
jgi:hypothetical protein